MKARNLRIASLCFGMALLTGVFFQNCSPVSFTPSELADGMADKSSLQPIICDDGQVSGSVKWELVSGQNIEEPGKCDFGGNLSLVYEKLQKVVCEEGKYIGSDDFKKGNLLGQKGGCDCDGGVTNGMSTWKNIEGQIISESQACPANGTLVLDYEKHQKYTCDNGKLLEVAEYQKGKLIKQSGECKCADGSTEGSTSIKVVPGATIMEPGLCPYGGNLQYTYEKEQKYLCQASQSVALNEFLRGKLINTTGACNCEGGVVSGGSKFVVLLNETISEPVVCKHGGNLVNIYEKQQKNLCSNGAFGAVAEYQKGAFLRQEGACNPPPVFNESFMISANKTMKPLDMVWVVDNSGSMSQEAAHVRTNLTSFINALDTSSDMKLLLLSQKGTSGYSVSLPAGLDPKRFIQVNQNVGSRNGPELLIDNLDSLINNGTPFFRMDSKKIIVFVTDDNSSMSASVFQSNLRNVGINDDKASIFGFVGLTKAISPCQASTGVVYQDLASQTKGKTYNICAADWSQHFTDLKTDILTKLDRTFLLKDTLAAKIVKVEVDGLAIDPSKYMFSNGAVTLSDEVTMTEQSSVKVSYTRE